MHEFTGVPPFPSPYFLPNSPILNIDDVFKALMVYDETGGRGYGMRPHSHTPTGMYAAVGVVPLHTHP